jgi:hypothetical protein
MRDDYDHVKVIRHLTDCFHQALSTFGILVAKALVDNQCAQLGAAAPRKQARQREPDGKIDAESLTAE